MVVWIELALLENFLIDGVLLFLSLKCAGARVRWFPLVFSSLAGAGQAVVFPLLRLPAWCAYAVKVLGGILLVVLAVRTKRPKEYVVATVAFFFFTFALGGALTAAYSFFGIEKADGNGYIVEQAPVGLVLGGAAAFAIAAFYAIRAAYRTVKLKRCLVECTLTAGDREVKWRGYADSGNRLRFRGEPVCVVSAAAIFALFGRGAAAVGRIEIGTVNGKRDAPVFLCEKMRVGNAERENVFLTVGDVDSGEYQMILHTALMEG